MTLEPLKPLMTPVIRIQEPTAKPRRPLVQVPQLLQVHLGVNVIEIQSAIVAGIIAAAVTRNSPEVFMRYLHTAIPSIGLSDLHFLGVFPLFCPPTDLTFLVCFPRVDAQSWNQTTVRGT